MPRRPVLVSWRPPGFSFAERAEATLLEVIDHLGLGPHIKVIRVLVRPLPGGDDGSISWSGRERLRVELSLDVGNFLTVRGREALCGRRGGGGAVDLGSLPGGRFSRRGLAATLFHEFGHVADDVAFGIHSGAIAPRGRAAFNEAWNVWIDGRLARGGAPGIRRRERWGLFRQAFEGGGMRGRPQRAIFDRLWRSDRLSHAELLDLARRLDGGRGGGINGRRRR